MDKLLEGNKQRQILTTSIWIYLVGRAVNGYGDRNTEF